MAWRINNSLIPKSHPVRLSKPVISIGNLSMGGTGKTPTIIYFLEVLNSKGFRPGVVSRSYKAQVNDPQKVVISDEGGAAKYGDEPTLIATKFPHVPVYVGRHKYQIAQKLDAEEDVDVILIDDGFQHRKLYRGLDIVLLDVSQSIDKYQVIPQGFLREPFEALKRAHKIIMTKENMADLNTYRFLMRDSEIKEKKMASFGYQIKYWIRNEKLMPIPASGKVFLVCGIANPESFKKLLIRKSVRLEIVGESFFDDHHRFTAEEWERILAKSSGHPILVTEKDWVKIKNLKGDLDSVYVARLDMYLQDGEKEINDVIDTYLS